jgi:exonuclease SbcD
MKILHTADVHLCDYEDERWKSLEHIIDIGKRENTDLFVISGDLFDEDVKSEVLRSKIRGLFSNNEFITVIIPGNHDSKSFSEDLYFGEELVILTDLNKPYEYNDVCVWGFPFEPISGEDILIKLKSISSKLDTTKTNILLFHGELIDTFYSRSDFGDEGEERYMPAKLSYFKNLGFDYILAGHFHSKFNFNKFEDNKYFVYPGSPVSITKKETGQRKVNLFEIGNPPFEFLLDTPHYVELTINLDPFVELNPVEIVKDKLQQLHPQAKVILTVKGYINSELIKMTEKELVNQLKDVTNDKVIDKNFEVRDIQRILEDDLFKSFLKKLREKNYSPEKKKEIMNLTIKAMMEVVQI